MTGAVIDVVAALVATMLVLLVPGAALLTAIRAWSPVPPLLRPAAAVGATIAVAAPLLVLTLSLHWSIRGLGVSLAMATAVLLAVALLRCPPRAAEGRGRWWSRLRCASPYAPPALVLVVLGIVDAPQVRSDTYWHVALARKLSELPALSSGRVAFEAGAAGNANYPLPVWHALTALAEQLPRVDVWFATWFMTPWLGVVAMLAFGAMAAALVGDRRAGLVGCWTFVAIVVLGYGPWFFATRYLSYPGQVAIFLLLPIAVVATATAIVATGRSRAAQLGVAAAATAIIGVLHGNYVLYPALFAGGAAALLLLGRRERVRAALAATGVVVGAGAMTLAVQLPWLFRDDNFLRGEGAPRGEPSAFVRHRDVFVGSEESFHVELGSLAAQPWLALGALALPALLWLARRRPGPWVLCGGAVAIALFARMPWTVDLLDRLGSVTPATRFDRVWPAAVGVVAIALAIGWLLERASRRDLRLGAAATVATALLLAASTWWLDSIRDTRRIVVTPFVEARWVGGLEPSGIPRMAVVASVVGIVLAAGWIRLRARIGELDGGDRVPLRERRHLLATVSVVAIAVGLAPATVERARASWEPQAYDRSARRDGDFARIEVYPAPVRRVVQSFEPGSTVLASLSENRRIASLVPVRSIEESVLRELADASPSSADAYATWAGLRRGSSSARLPTRAYDYVVVPRDDPAFSGLAAFHGGFCGWDDRSVGNLRIYGRRGDRC